MAEMCEVAATHSAGRYSFVTLTYGPTAPYVDGVVPSRHLRCLRSTHVRDFGNGKGLFWTVQADCPSCLRDDSARFVKFRKRFQRRYPGASFLVVREATKLGVLHLHLVIVGLPFVIRPKSRVEARLRECWAGVGGGYIRVTLKRGSSGRRVGRYVAKYASKSLGRTRSARRYRMWRRSRDFAPEVKMFGYRPASPPRAPSELVDALKAGEYARSWQYLEPDVPVPVVPRVTLEDFGYVPGLTERAMRTLSQLGAV
jgi:hypothetical protein